MELQLKRIDLKPNITEGNLSIVNNKFLCYSIEDTVRAELGKWNPKVKIYGKTAIPYGRYQVLVTWSNKFKRLLPEILNVPDFTGIRIHNGINENSSAGCIIISYTKPFNYNKNAMNDLTTLLFETQKKEKIFINVI